MPSSNLLIDESRNIRDLRQNVIFNLLNEIRFCANCVRSCRTDTSTGFMPNTAKTSLKKQKQAQSQNRFIEKKKREAHLAVVTVR